MEKIWNKMKISHHERRFDVYIIETKQKKNK